MEHSPNAVLKRLRELMDKQTRQGAPAVAPWSAADTNELVTHLFDLDEYLTSGGVLPDAWDTAIRPADAEEIRGLTARKLANRLKKRGIPIGELGGQEHIEITERISVSVGTASAWAVYHPGNGVTKDLTPRLFISELVNDLNVLIQLHGKE